MILGIENKDKQKDQPKKPAETKPTQESQKPKANEAKPKATPSTETLTAERKYSVEEEKLNFQTKEAATTNNAYIDKSKFNIVYPPIKYKTEAYWITSNWLFVLI